MRNVGLSVALLLVGCSGNPVPLTPPAPVQPSFLGSARPPMQTLRFSAPRAYDAGRDAVAVAAGDLNADGIVDLVVTAAGDDAVGVLLGAGDGTFRERIAFEAGRGASGLTLADLDLDGSLDVIVTNQAGQSVSVLKGFGDGTLDRAERHAVGPEPRAVAVADFDGDGAPDLAVANHGNDSVSLLRGRGDGAFDNAIQWDVRPGPSAIVVGDFNSDGLPDLAVGADGGLTVRLGAGAGRFASPVAMPVGERPTQLVASDLDGNGHADLVSLAEGGPAVDGNVSALLSAGNGRFRAPYSLPETAPRAVTTGDLDGDGAADLVLASAGARNVSVLHGQGDGSFLSAGMIDAGAPCSALLALDLNHDGQVDLVTITADGLTILLQSAQ